MVFQTPMSARGVWHQATRATCNTKKAYITTFLSRGPVNLSAAIVDSTIPRAHTHRRRRPGGKSWHGRNTRRPVFVLFLPALSILAAAGVIAIGDLVGLGIKSSGKTAFISILVVLAIWLQSFYSQRYYLLESDPVKVSRANFGTFPFPEVLEIAKFIKSHSNESDKIAVLGSEPEIFFYSHRRSATAYIYTYPLMEPQPYAVDMQHEMISQIEAGKPRFIVFVDCSNSWYFRQNSEKLIFDWMKQYLSSYYQ